MAPAGVLAVWYLVAASGQISPLFLPRPSAVLDAIVRLTVSGDLWVATGMTLLRVLIATVISGVIGIPVGLMLGYWRRLYEAAETLVDFLRSLPALALFPLMLLVFGIGEGAKLSTAVIAGALVLVISGVYGVRNASRARRQAVELLGATRRQLFLTVVGPDAMPELASGLRIALSLVLVVVVVTEMFAGTGGGVGQELFTAQLTYRVPELYAWILVAGLLGYVLNRMTAAAESRLVHWRGR